MCLGIPGKIVGVSEDGSPQGVVDIGGIQRGVDLSCVAQEVVALGELVGQWVLVHVGFAMSLINESEARATLAVLTELGQMQEELTALREGAA